MNVCTNMNSSTDKSSYLSIIKDWLAKQQHLPQNIDDRLIYRFLHTCNYSPEQTKTLIDLFYTLRSQAPEIFADRDPASPELQEIFETLDFIPMQKLTPENRKIFIYRIRSPDPAKYVFNNAVKAFFMFADVRMVVEDTISDGEVPIYDMTNFTLKHSTRFNLPVLKKFMMYSQEAHPIKLKEIHLLNVPPFLDKVMQLVRPFMKSEIGKMMHTHVPNSTTIYDFVPKDILPADYGGDAGNIEDIKKWWMGKVMEHRDYLMDESRWAVDESKRPSDNNNSEKKMFGMEGSFRSLAID